MHHPASPPERAKTVAGPPHSVAHCCAAATAGRNTGRRLASGRGRFGGAPALQPRGADRARLRGAGPRLTRLEGAAPWYPVFGSAPPAGRAPPRESARMAAMAAANPLRLRGHLPALDGLRGVAVALVVLLHFTLFVPAGPVESFFSRGVGTGWMGVDLFFVLSGFLITGILYDSRDSPAYFRNFYARRSLRIFPLYYAYLFAIFAVLPRVQAGAAGPAEESARIWVWTYLSNVLFARGGWEVMPGHTTHLWSLAVEEQFYLLWFAAVVMAPRRWLLPTIVGCLVVAPIFRGLLAPETA
ncbi:MAG: acyltransferase, partial [Gemmatimonadetes bacterium]|nr:acyltransferase [Gemmatimonadota bacterium]